MHHSSDAQSLNSSRQGQEHWEHPIEHVDLDASSATPLADVARTTLLAALDAGWADPRRLHREGRRARMLLDNAREVVAQATGSRPDEVTFTSSGTAAVHQGLLGLARGRRRHGRTVALSAVEHSSVLHALDWADTPRVELPVDAAGHVRRDALVELLTPHRDDLGVLAVQSANHEVGTLQDLPGLLEGARSVREDVPLFTDACASWGHAVVPDVWDVAAGSAHKWGGPAGVGVLVVRKGTRWRSAFPADDRADERSSGFENVPGVLAAAAALQERGVPAPDRDPRTQLIETIRARVSSWPDVDVVGDPVARLPHVLTFSCLYLDGESLVSELDRRGFGISSGSACTASTLKPSHVLAAMGALTHGNVRVSLHDGTEPAAVERFLTVLPEVIAQLRSRIGL